MKAPQNILAGAFMPPIDERPWGRRRERWISLFGLGFTLLAVCFVAVEQVPLLRKEWSDGAWGAWAGHLGFLALAGALVYGGLVYQITRCLYTKRRRGYVTCPPHVLPEGAAHPRVAILVPSYKEEHAVIYQTLLSAALQPVPELRVTLLIDNPPQPQDPDDCALLEAARDVPQRMAEALEAIHSEVVGHLDAGDATAAARCAGNWLMAEAERWLQPQANHTDRFFACEILLDRALAFNDQARRGEVDQETLRHTFAVTLSSFERKQHPNLSHQPNKATNLNSYIGLMGGTWTWDPDGILHQVAPESTSTSDTPLLPVPAPDFIVALDADSLILPDYARCMLAELTPARHSRRAVCQTPYSAIPGASTQVERVAGATTDVQYIIHQGFTAWSGTYWVGANAMIRYAALLDIAETFEERGWTLRRFIQDRTAIEDTESSIDLALRGWSLHNVPRRLAYSATPPDFGSLLIQRRRWSNGGLLILGKALRLLGHRLREGGSRHTLRALGEAWVRIHYLVSITTVNLGLLILLAYPFSSSVVSYWLPLTAVPYFALYGRDLWLMGYRWSDLFRVYALNLALIPVHLGGVLQSVRQGIFRTRPSFPRTPKTALRTPTARPYVAVMLVLVVQWTLGSIWDFRQGYVTHGLFAGLNAGILLYAVLAFIGPRAALEDV
jgi:cellulose synthase/poly-beta-1,6-N-acetylglucosamine synthase-like glycosyltransferase